INRPRRAPIPTAGRMAECVPPFCSWLILIRKPTSRPTAAPVTIPLAHLSPEASPMKASDEPPNSALAAFRGAADRMGGGEVKPARAPARDCDRSGKTAVVAATATAKKRNRILALLR